MIAKTSQKRTSGKINAFKKASWKNMLWKVFLVWYWKKNLFFTSIPFIRSWTNNNYYIIQMGKSKSLENQTSFGHPKAILNIKFETSFANNDIIFNISLSIFSLLYMQPTHSICTYVNSFVLKVKDNILTFLL
jgi:hypothetical protein